MNEKGIFTHITLKRAQRDILLTLEDPPGTIGLDLIPISHYWEALTDECTQNPDTTIFTLLNLPDTHETRAKIITAYGRQFLKEFLPHLLDDQELPTDTHSIENSIIRLNQLYTDIDHLLNGVTCFTDSEGQVHTMPYAQLRREDSLMRHLARSSSIASLILTQLDPGKLNNDPSIYQKVAAGVIAAHMHDLGRFVTHELAHDEIERIIFNSIPVHQDVIASLHEPPPLDPQEQAAVDIATYDTLAQAVVRFSDLLGKVTRERLYRTSPEEVRIYSKERQMLAFNNDDPAYRGKTEADVDAYCQLEEALLIAAAQKISSFLKEPTVWDGWEQFRNEGGNEVFALLTQLNQTLQTGGRLPDKYQSLAGHYLI